MPEAQPDELGRLGVYVLRGRISEPSAAIGQARSAEHLGLGTGWLAERYGSKDLGVTAGAGGEATSRGAVGSGISHFPVRHPIVVASIATTFQAMVGRPVTPRVGL